MKRKVNSQADVCLLCTVSCVVCTVYITHYTLNSVSLVLVVSCTFFLQKAGSPLISFLSDSQSLFCVVCGMHSFKTIRPIDFVSSIETSVVKQRA